MTFQHRFDDSIRCDNEIHGVVGEMLSVKDAYSVGRGVATLVRRAGGSAVAVGEDGRDSSEALYKAVCVGVTDAGAKAYGIGLGTSPMLDYATAQLPVDGGIMVTGSHTPAGRNGFMIRIGTEEITPCLLDELMRIVENGNVEEGLGEIIEHPVKTDYIRTLVERLDGCGEFSCAWDTSNGAVGAILEDVLGRLPGHHYAINIPVDGKFPRHQPDPSDPENLAQLQDLTVSHKCDIGFAFDGDGDRLGVIDKHGRVVSPDRYLALLARSVLKNLPGANIVTDMNASDALVQSVEQSGGRVDMAPSGAGTVKKRMQDVCAPLAGDSDGHVFMADSWFGFSDGLYAALRLLEVMASEKTMVDQFVDSMPGNGSPVERHIPCDGELRFKIVGEVGNLLVNKDVELASDQGVRVRSPNGWWMLRPSNSGPYLVASFEAEDQWRLQNLCNELGDILQGLGLETGQLRESVGHA